MVLGGENLHFSTLLVCFSLASSSRKCIVSPSSPSPPQFTGLQSDHLLLGYVHHTAPTSSRHTILPDLVGYMPSTGL